MQLTGKTCAVGVTVQHVHSGIRLIILQGYSCIRPDAAISVGALQSFNTGGPLGWSPSPFGWVAIGGPGFRDCWRAPGGMQDLEVGCSVRQDNQSDLQQEGLEAVRVF